MSYAPPIPVRPSRSGEPVWEMLDILPEQGRWTETDYLKIETNRAVEFKDGFIQVAPMPTLTHQVILTFLWSILSQLKIDGHKGMAVPSAFRLKLRDDLWREPDICYLLPQNLHLLRDAHWEYADLVIEIVSPDDPSRDYVEKREDYAAARIPEYWIVDPRHLTVLVLVLDGSGYREAQSAGIGDVAVSPTVTGFEVNVAEMFAQAKF
jgi:Uma2 family endonuclease